jgi:hypothetical protein
MNEDDDYFDDCFADILRVINGAEKYEVVTSLEFDLARTAVDTLRATIRADGRRNAPVKAEPVVALAN